VDGGYPSGTLHPQETGMLGSSSHSKLIFRIKRDKFGNIKKYKARLVAQGYSQVEGEDFYETYAPVAKMTTFRALIAIATINDLILWQTDVTAAYLNADLDEEIFMRLLLG
jgi:hypothetical protein